MPKPTNRTSGQPCTPRQRICTRSNTAWLAAVEVWLDTASPAITCAAPSDRSPTPRASSLAVGGAEGAQEIAAPRQLDPLRRRPFAAWRVERSARRRRPGAGMRSPCPPRRCMNACGDPGSRLSRIMTPAFVHAFVYLDAGHARDDLAVARQRPPHELKRVGRVPDVGARAGHADLPAATRSTIPRPRPRRCRCRSRPALRRSTRSRTPRSRSTRRRGPSTRVPPARRAAIGIVSAPIRRHVPPSTAGYASKRLPRRDSHSHCGAVPPPLRCSWTGRPWRRGAGMRGPCRPRPA